MLSATQITHNYFHGGISNPQIQVDTHPTQLDIHNKIMDKLDQFYKSNKIPNLIFHGVSGSGKRTIVNAFLCKIYNCDKAKMKANVMAVNCAHGKGIKFIREDLKFFAKTNIQSNSGIPFKTIVLMNADFLTIDAQSALRRCIELFSNNTRFFIIVENKHKLLNPILSRFCEIYVPEYIENGEIKNLHQYSLCNKYNFPNKHEHNEWITTKLNAVAGLDEIHHTRLISLSEEIYEAGLSSLDIMQWVKATDHIDPTEKAKAGISFDKIRSEYRCEKLLMLYMLDFLFMRSNNDLKSLSSI
jgi:DNA polymerase III delta prime subunit